MPMRPAQREDIDRVLAIHTAAFPDDRGTAARKRNFEQTRFGRFDDLRVLEDDATRTVIAHAFSFPFEVFFGGKAVKTAGIASVGVAPEARGRGAARRLIEALEAEARERGDVLALLHPFRQSFYAKLGYAPVTPLARIETSTHAIPDAWVKRARDATIRASTADDAGAVHALYLRQARRTTGLLMRPPQLWERKDLDERRHVLVLERSGVLVGYVAYVLRQEEPHADVALWVEELVFDDDDARRTLVGALCAQRDQARTLGLLTPLDDWLVLALEDPDRDWSGTETVAHAFGALATGPMLKVLDVEAALAARGYLAAGSASMRVGPDGPAITVAVEGGTGRVSRGGDAPNHTPVVVSPSALASIFFGTLSPTHAASLGWLDGPREAVRALDALVRLPPFEVVDAF